MKAFLVFGGDYYYPAGGWDDFQDSFDTAEDAFALARKLVETTEVTVGSYTYNRADCDWTHVVDAATGMRLDSFQKEGR